MSKYVLAVASFIFAALGVFFQAIPPIFGGALAYTLIGHGPFVAALGGALGIAATSVPTTFFEMESRKAFGRFFARMVVQAMKENAPEAPAPTQEGPPPPTAPTGGA